MEEEKAEGLTLPGLTIHNFKITIKLENQDSVALMKEKTNRSREQN